MPSLSLTTGVVRDRRAILGGVCTDGGTEEFEVVVRGTGGKTLRRFPLRDLLVTDTEAAVVVADAFRAEAPLDGLDGPICGVEVRHMSGAGAVTAKLGYQLSRLFLETDAEFESASFGTKREARPADKETDCFLSRQMATFFAGSREYRILMSIAYCYRSTELMSEPEMANALDLLDSSALLLEGVGAEASTFRKDPTHLHFSMLTARWHAELALGRIGAFRNTLDQILRDAPRAALSDQFFSITYNLVRSLLILAVDRTRLGDAAVTLEALQAARKILQRAAHSLAEGDELQDFGETCIALAALRPLAKAQAKYVRTKGGAPAWAGFSTQDFNGTLDRCLRVSNKATLKKCFYAAD